MRIPRANKLIERIVTYDLRGFEVESYQLANKVQLKSMSVDLFLNHVKDSCSKSIFYLYKYYKKEDYIIPLDWYSEETEKFKADVENHNSEVEKYDFDIPNKMSLFTIIEGIFLGVEFFDEWLEVEMLEDAEEMIEKIEEKYYGSRHELKRTKREDKKRDEEELRKILFNDPEFAYCKNQDMRYWHLGELLELDEMKKYRYLFEPNFGIPSTGKAKVFLDKTWMLYLEEKKKMDKKTKELLFSELHIKDQEVIVRT